MKLKGLETVGTCICCGKPLKPEQMVWLECDSRDGSYHEDGTVPLEYSQGAFELGRTCAKKALKRVTQ
jgi:hypothetical protein